VLFVGLCVYVFVSVDYVFVRDVLRDEMTSFCFAFTRCLTKSVTSGTRQQRLHQDHLVHVYVSVSTS
jgi:hypothetical protein